MVEKARKVADELSVKFEQNLQYYSTFNDYFIEAVFDEIENNLLMYDQIVKITSEYDSEEYSDTVRDKYIEHLKLYSDLLE